MKKIVVALFFALYSICIFSQEALKSLEEEYYDFLALHGTIERPTLNYRTLSDSVWSIGTETKTFTDENGNEQTVEELLSHPWQNNNLGKMRTLWQPQALSENGYLRGVPQGVFLKIYGPEWYNSFNTAAPYGQNDGALWQGKGYNTSLTAGARLEGYGLELTIKPQVSFSQNMEFELVGEGVYGNKYSYFWKGNIDLPQRFGDKHFWTFDWGDTEVRYSWRTLTVGFGTQAIWLGPAWLNPMLGSNNAPTYPKFDIGLRRQRIVIPKVNWYLGDIEGRIWMGQLSESDYFDNNPENDYRQVTGFSVAYSPSFLPGFTIGATKICINDWRHKSIKYLNPFYSTNGSQTGDRIDEDQKMSFFVDWIFPKIGFEVYGEIGKDDYSNHKTANPFHTVIYTVGFKQRIPFLEKYNIYFELLGEMNNFEMSQDFQLQWQYMGYYSHGGIAQGYTQKGQILGAGTGFFGRSEFLGLRMYWKRGSAMIYYHRHAPDDNYVYNKAVGMSVPEDYEELKKYRAHNKTFKTFGIEGSFFVTKGLNINATFNSIFVNYPKYTDEDTGFMTFRICLGLKYNI